MGDLRLLTYNLHGLRDDVDAIGEVVRACKPDVVCVQEAPRFLRWRSKRAAIARNCGLVVATADRPGGLMLMVSLRVRVLDTRFTTLSKRPQLHQRAVCSADLLVDDTQWTVASVHMSLDDDERQAHLPEVWTALGTSTPVVLAGDINEEPGGPVWHALTAQLTDAWAASGTGAGNTFSAKQPHKRIDGIFVSHDVDVVECHSVDDVAGVQAASDHLPVLAVLRASS